jgi:quercetin 2,3-dioxygenase
MSNLVPTTAAELCVSEPVGRPTLEALPGRLTDVGGLPIRRLLPRSQRRLVGPWCFLDSYGPLTFSSRKAMDVGSHPHMGLQTVSWLLDGELLHHDSLGFVGPAHPGVLNLMTAGRGIAHSEETPLQNTGRLRGVQLWVALPGPRRETAPAFDQHRSLPIVDLEGGQATLIMGELTGARSPARAFSPIVGADVAGEPGRRLVLPLDSGFEHALVLLQGGCRLDGQPLSIDTLYYLGCGRAELVIHPEGEPCRVLLLGGAPFGETILMWWNFVGRTSEEIVAAREDWQAGRRFGDVRAYTGPRLEAPPFIARPVPRP